MEIGNLTIEKAREMLRNKELSVKELTEAHLQNIKKITKI